MNPLLKLTFSLVVGIAIAPVTTSADEPVNTPASAAALPNSPPMPGPDLLKYTPEQIEAAYEGRALPEAVRMYLAIVRGGQMSANEGWFGPAQSRLSWQSLTALHGDPEVKHLTKENFVGRDDFFSALDRNHDERITPDDLDWSDQNRWVQQSAMVNRFFRRMDPSGDGRLTREEWLAYFDQLSMGEDAIGSEQLRDSWLVEAPRGFTPGDEPQKDVLIRGLMAGEIGSLQEGPALNDPAPDFELTTVDGDQVIRLSSLFGQKPVVLVFGNFTCGPFRSLFPAVDQISRKYADDASFLMIYVREAHPTDGWAMKSNERAGVQVAQPQNYDERRAVAGQCEAMFHPSMPLLVDEIADPVGNAYSGMPARLYVLDSAGRVAYKSGRGPFGFKCGEMEQALVQVLMQQQKQP